MLQRRTYFKTNSCAKINISEEVIQSFYSCISKSFFMLNLFVVEFHDNNKIVMKPTHAISLQLRDLLMYVEEVKFSETDLH